jgi:hypothetical protein
MTEQEIARGGVWYRVVCYGDRCKCPARCEYWTDNPCRAEHIIETQRGGPKPA